MRKGTSQSGSTYPLPSPSPTPGGLYLLGAILSDQSHLGGSVLLGHHGHLGWQVITLFLHL